MKAKWKKITLDKHSVSRHKGVTYLRANTSAENPKDIIILADYKPFVTNGITNEIIRGSFFAFAYREVPIFSPHLTQICVVISQKPTVDIFIDKKRGNKIFIPNFGFKDDHFPPHDNGEMARIHIWDGHYILSDVHGKEIIVDNRCEFDCSLDPSCAKAALIDTRGADALEASMRHFTSAKYWESKC